MENVYSIWICTNCPQYAQNTITEYKIQPENIFGGYQGKARYDILNVTFMRLGDQDKKDIPSILSLLAIVLSKYLTREEKKKRLENEHGIPMTREVEQEVGDLCNLADAIEEEAIMKTAKANAKKLFENSASYELVRASIDALSDEDLQEIYNQVMEAKKSNIKK